jgi:hypothetical protein
LVTYFSKKGTASKGKKPPITIPKAALFKSGSANAAIKSATICAKTIPTIPAIAPLDIIFKKRFILQPV